MTRRESRFRYIAGAFAGVGAVLVLAVLVGISTAFWWAAVVATQALVAGLVFGALGALASVSQRLLGESIQLDFRASRRPPGVDDQDLTTGF